MLKSLKVLFGFSLFFAIWQILAQLFAVPEFILPKPSDIALALIEQKNSLFTDSLITGSEILLGFILGSLLGILTALLLISFPRFKNVAQPILVVSQAIPVYALAPILVLWLGYDMAPKIAMAVIIIFFPVTSAFYDGLSQTQQGWLDLYKSMGASSKQILFKVRLPSALPQLATGLRMAAALAPIGAIVGEWVGASSGLGFRMIYTNARLQTAEMFTALFVLVFIALSFYYLVDFLLKKAMPWHQTK